MGALTLFIGIIFFFKYAVDNQWIDALGRVALGIIAGFALLGGGEWLRQQAQTIFAQGVSACGIATVYITAYAASDYYKLVDPAWAFVAFLVTSAGALFLSIRASDAVLSVVGYLGAIVAPGLFRVMDSTIWSASVWAWFGFVYLLLINVFVLIHAGVQSKRFLVPIMAIATAAETFWLINPKHALVCVLFFLALAALHFRSPKWGPAAAQVAADAYIVAHALVLLAGFRFLVFWFETVSTPETRSSLLSEAESVFLGVYGALLLASAVFRRSAADRLIGLVLLAAVIVKLYVVDVWFLARFYRISAFVALGLLLLASSFIYSRWKQRSSS